MDEEEEGKEPNAEQPFTRKKYRKSTVDDKFFSLAKMHEHLEALEKGQEEGEEAGLFDGVEVTVILRSTCDYCMICVINIQSASLRA